MTEKANQRKSKALHESAARMEKFYTLLFELFLPGELFKDQEEGINFLFATAFPRKSQAHINEHEFLGLCMQVLEPKEALITMMHIRTCSACSQSFWEFHARYRKIEQEEMANPENYMTDKDQIARMQKLRKR